MSSRSGVPAPLVLLGATVVLLAGGFVGFRLLTAEADAGPAEPTCETRVVAADEEVTSNLVKVNVYNSSSVAGLANRVSINLQRRGFLAGQIGNYEGDLDVKAVTVLTDDPDDPRVRLVRAQFEDVEIADPDPSLPSDAISVIVGDDYEELGKDVRSTENDREFTVCLPILPET